MPPGRLSFLVGKGLIIPTLLTERMKGKIQWVYPSASDSFTADTLASTKFHVCRCTHGRPISLTVYASISVERSDFCRFLSDTTADHNTADNQLHR
jgi:hypothetical protein